MEKHGTRRHSTTNSFSEIRELKGDFTRDDSQLQFLAQRNVATLFRIAATLQRCVPLKIVVANRPVCHVTSGALRSDNRDVHENVAKKQTSHHFKLFRDYPNSSC